MGRQIDGIVKEVYTASVSRTIKGKIIKRNGTAENPAYLVESIAGNLALKLQSELTKATTTKLKSSASTPKMFS